MPIIFATIAQSGQVTGDIDLSKHALVGIAVPELTSADLLYRANYDTTSAGFLRVQKTQPNTGPITWATGPGSVMLYALTDVGQFNYARLETSVPQADVRTLTLLVR